MSLLNLSMWLCVHVLYFIILWNVDYHSMNQQKNERKRLHTLFIVILVTLTNILLQKWLPSDYCVDTIAERATKIAK